VYSAVKAKIVMYFATTIFINEDKTQSRRSTSINSSTRNKGFFDCLIQDNSTTTTNSSSESIELLIEQYLALPCIQQDEDPFLF
jgi:hypothetical protein